MSTSNTHAKLWDLIKDTRFGMLTHRHDDGHVAQPSADHAEQELDEGATLSSSCRRMARSCATSPPMAA